MAAADKHYGKLVVFAVLMAIVAVSAAVIAVGSMDEVRSGAASPFAALLWAAAAAISGLLGVILAAVAIARSKKPGPAASATHGR